MRRPTPVSAPWRVLYRATALGSAIFAAACGDNALPTDAVTTKTTGAIKVTVSMTGADLPAAYSVRGDFGTVFANRADSALFTQVPPGSRLVELRLPPNCQVEGENPRVVAVAAGQIAAVSFAATCVATTGFVRVSAPTAGVALDADGYVVWAVGLDQTNVPYELPERVTVNGTTVISVPVGTATLTLKAVALNCFSTGQQPVTVRPADTASVVFPVECGPKAQLAFVGATANGDIYTMDEDGGDVRRLTTEPSLEADPAWSPNGDRLAFTSDRGGNLEIYTMNGDGSGVVRLTNDPAADYQPTWSPDGRKIAFASTRTGNAQIFVMNADGTDPVRLTKSPGEDFAPAWSPDGRIAFTTTRSGGSQLYALNPDGTGEVRLTPDEGKYPAWSRDGSELAYSTTYCSYYYSPLGCYPTILVSAGSATVAAFTGERASWSSDGRKIAFNGFDCNFSGSTNTCVAAPFRIARLDGTDVVTMIAGSSPAWRPK